MRRMQTTGIAILFLLLTAAGAMGTEATTKSAAKDSPRQLKDSIVVTANRFGLDRSKMVWPSVTMEIVPTSATTSMEELLEGQGGVDVRGYNGVGSVATLSSWGLFNRHMLLLYDGRVVKDYSLGGFNLADFSAAEFERIEIIKGPQSAFYGADAVGGVVNLISPSSLIDRTSFGVTYGTFNFQQHRLDLSRRVGDIGLSGWVEYNATDNDRDNAGAQRLLAGVRSDYLSKNNRHHLRLSGRYFNDSLGVPGPVPDSKYVPVYGNDESESLLNHQKDENYSTDLQYSYNNESFGQVRVDLFWEKKNLEFDRLYNYFSWPYETTDTTVDPPVTYYNTDSVDVNTQSIYDKRSSGINVRYQKEEDKLSLAGGIDFLSGSMKVTNNNNTTATVIAGQFVSFESASNSHNFWSASQDQFDLWSAVGYDAHQRLRLDLSGRINLIKGRNGQPSYNLGIVFRPEEDLRVKLGYGYAFRLPSLADQFADDVYTAGNANLNPETSRSLVGTVSIRPADGLASAEISTFYQTVDSLIQYRGVDNFYRSVPVNIEKFKSTGVDVSVSVRPSSSVSLNWSGVYQSAKQTTDAGKTFTSAYYIPDRKWRMDVTGHRGIVDGRFNMTYTSEREIVMYGGLPKLIEAVYEFGFTLSARVNSQVRLSLTGFDLTDQKRPDQFGFTTGDGDYPTPGRRFVLGVSVDL